MTIYHGVVKGNAVLLPESVSLPDGTEVEIRVSDVSDPADEQQREELFKQELLKAGLISEIKRPTHRPESGERKLIQVRGQPLSEMIIEERR